jgi:hypothetical protein
VAQGLQTASQKLPGRTGVKHWAGESMGQGEVGLMVMKQRPGVPPGNSGSQLGGLKWVRLGVWRVEEWLGRF